MDVTIFPMLYQKEKKIRNLIKVMNASGIHLFNLPFDIPESCDCKRCVIAFLRSSFLESHSRLRNLNAPFLGGSRPLDQTARVWPLLSRFCVKIILEVARASNLYLRIREAVDRETR